MADYFPQTVLRQTIPACFISPLERLLLGLIFESEDHNGSIYYYASEAPADLITPDRQDLEDALAATTGRSRLRPFVTARLAEAKPDQAFLDIDLTAIPQRDPAHIVILQDIVRRSKGELPSLSIAQAYTCNKMRPDGFGGAGIIITAKRVLYQCTYGFFSRFDLLHPPKPAPSP
jgi:hypothetical protein